MPDLEENIEAVANSKQCGIIMPISAFPNDEIYTAAHWLRVKAIIQRATKRAGYDSELVSAADIPTFIHATIIRNIYAHDIVICDVSGLNPNVLFELGLRLAAEKPVIIIRDSKTRRIFDTGPIEDFEYRQDLRYDDAEALEGKIERAIRNFTQQLKDGTYKSFLSEIQIPNLKLATPTQEDVELIPYIELISQKIDSLINKPTQASQITAQSYSGGWPAPSAVSNYSAIYQTVTNHLRAVPAGSLTKEEVLDKGLEWLGGMQSLQPIGIPTYQPIGRNPADLAAYKAIILWIVEEFANPQRTPHIVFKQ